MEKRINDIVNRLNKTKQELYPDLAAERENYDRGIRAARKAEAQVWHLLPMQYAEPQLRASCNTSPEDAVQKLGAFLTLRRNSPPL